MNSKHKRKPLTRFSHSDDQLTKPPSSRTFAQKRAELLVYAAPVAVPGTHEPWPEPHFLPGWDDLDEGPLVPLNLESLHIFFAIAKHKHRKSIK